MVKIMPNSKIVSDFENYDNGRETIQFEELTKKYDRIEAQLRLLYELAEGRRSGEEGGWISSKDVRNYFKARANTK